MTCRVPAAGHAFSAARLDVGATAPPIELDAVWHVYAGQPLTASVMTALDSVADRVAAAGYPIR